MKVDHLGFTINLSQITGSVFIPKYYDPEIEERLEQLSATHDHAVLGNMVDKGYLSLSTGHEIGKMSYGTGDIPFVRTSDISNWEIKIKPKQGVSEDIYAQYSERQDVKAGDIFLVRDGTYLIGQSCMVTEHDLPLLYQSHIFKIRVTLESPISNYLLFALLNSPIVRRQIRAKQFTADIIDTIGNRLLEVILPVPKDQSVRDRIAQETHSVITRRIAFRENIRRIPLLTQGLLPTLDDAIPSEASFYEQATTNAGFTISLREIVRNVFIPRYYDPQTTADLKDLSETHNTVSLSELVSQGILAWQTGIEVGKMAYGTGPIPFIRTSDISNWELKVDPKQNVSEEIYEANKQDVQAEDIFVVRDGTYLVGTSAIITQHDTKILYCGGLYKLRVLQKEELDPYLLLALLNTPIVKRQMRAKQFTRDIIDTVGKRLFEVLVPIPKSKALRERVAQEARKAVETRVQLRNRAKEIVLKVEGITAPRGEELEVWEQVWPARH